MKKVLLLLSILILTSNLAKAQDEQPQFPYGKMLKMTNQELLDAKFKYDKNKNQYVLTKRNGLNATANALSPFASTPTNYKPHVNDYQVIIQKGEKKTATAWISVIFYDSEIYHKILTFAADHGENLLETDTKSLNKTQFNYGGYSFVAEYATKSQSAATANSLGTTIKDESYNKYIFTISTDVKEYSEYLIDQAEKEAKRDSKGKKKSSAEDLM